MQITGTTRAEILHVITPLHGESQPGFWKKSSWNESRDYMEKVFARAVFQPRLDGCKTLCNLSKISARVGMRVWAGALTEYLTEQNGGNEKIVLKPGPGSTRAENSPCNRNKISARAEIRHVITPLKNGTWSYYVP